MLTRHLVTTASLAVAAALCAAPATAKAPKVLYNFQGGANGSAPYADLVFYKGLFYGTTSSDGTYGGGTIFSLDPKTQKQAVIYAFNGTDGLSPASPLLAVGHLLYGATLTAGEANDGNIFSIDPKTSRERTVHAFAGTPNDGADPLGDLASDGTHLYGVTFYGGAQNGGTVFKVDIATGAETTLHTFTGGSDGLYPRGGLVLLNGILYGTAEFGASSQCSDASASGCGTVFSIDPATGVFTTLYSFQGGTDAANPAGGLTAANGLLYGTATQGGSANCKSLGCGAVFQIDPASGTETVLYRFNAGSTNTSDGAYPFGGVSYLDGALYGTTEAGGRGGCDGGAGTLYKIDLATNAETQIYRFDPKKGCPYPVARPILHGSEFYGSTPGGGSSYDGAIFKFKP